MDIASPLLPHLCAIAGFVSAIAFHKAQAELTGQQFGADGMEISAHSGARPEHVWFQGHQYAMDVYRREVEGYLEDYNCYHRAFPILVGISVPAHTQEELDAIIANDMVVRTYGGSAYNGYEARQKQRQIETAIRKQKDRAAAAAAAGDKEAEQQAIIRANELTRHYGAFSKAMGLSTHPNLITTVGFSRSQAGQLGALTRAFNNALQGGAGGGILNAKMSIANPIENRLRPRGDPAGIANAYAGLNSRQELLLSWLTEVNSRVIVGKSEVSMNDLSALSAATQVEFAMFTRGSQRLIIRGIADKVFVNTDDALLLKGQGYKWSGHTHINKGFAGLVPSDGDIAVLEAFAQRYSVLQNASGQIGFVGGDPHGR